VISRREFLRGKFSPPAKQPETSLPPGTPGVATIGPQCVALNNVVCRSCGDACGEYAIKFSPRLGGAALPAVLAESCTACGDCVSACPANAVSLAAIVSPTSG